MSAGELRDYVQIESIVQGSPNNGDYTQADTWGVVASVWARIKYTKSSESSENRDTTTSKAEIKIRHRSDLNNNMRITFNGKIFDFEDNFDASSKGAYLTINTQVREGSAATDPVILAPANRSTHTDITGGHAVYGVLTRVGNLYTVSAGRYKSGSLVIDGGGVAINDFTETDTTAGTFTIGYDVGSAVVRARYEI